MIRYALTMTEATPTTSPDSSEAGHPPDRALAMRVVSMPRDTNPNGTIFGGVILSYIDQAAMVAALNSPSSEIPAARCAASSASAGSIVT